MIDGLQRIRLIVVFPEFGTRLAVTPAAIRRN